MVFTIRTMVIEMMITIHISLLRTMTLTEVTMMALMMTVNMMMINIMTAASVTYLLAHY